MYKRIKEGKQDAEQHCVAKAIYSKAFDKIGSY